MLSGQVVSAMQARAMTTLELERIARNVIPSTNTTGWRLTEFGSAADGVTVYGVVPIIDKMRDSRRMHELLTGRTPTSRRAHDIPAASVRVDEPDRALTEAPDAVDTTERIAPRSEPRATEEALTSGASTLRLCEGCDQPLPEGSRPNRRTHDDACRQRAQYRRAHEPARADADGRTTDLTVSRATAAPASPAGPDDPAPISGALQRQPDQGQREAPVPAGLAREGVQLALPTPAN